MKKRGVSNIIAIIVIILVSISLVIGIWSVIKSQVQKTSFEAEKKIYTVSNINLKVVDAYIQEGNLYIIVENTGQQDITSFVVRVTGTLNTYLNNSVYLLNKEKLGPLNTRDIIIIPAPDLEIYGKYTKIEVWPKFEYNGKEEIAATAKDEFTFKIAENEEPYGTIPIVPPIGEITLTGEPFFNMQIESASLTPEEASIETTGATYILSRTGMELWRRIDPKTNTINPRKVATLTFNEDIGSLSVESTNKTEVIIQSDKLKFTFNSDSFFFIEAKQPILYTHTNLISNAPWNKGSGRDRMWTDGYGGSLHAWISGNVVVTEEKVDSTKFSMSTGDTIAHMVFPPKLFDFERLYGQNSRPFVQFVYSEAMIRAAMTPDKLNEYKDNGFGVFMLWNSIYECDNEIECYQPVVLDSGVLGYKVKPSLAPLVKEFVDFAHDNGFKVIFYHYDKEQPDWNYPSGHPKVGQHQGIELTLQNMRDLQKEYGIDGWYFDNADVGNLIEDYNFIRQVRTDLGDSGIIFHHDSVDIWDGWLKYSGLRAIMINAYVDYTVTGETGESIAMTHSPNDPYLRYFSSGYGMSQAYASDILLTNGKAAMSEGEKNRALGQNLNGAERNLGNSWLVYFKPGYDKRKQEYLSGNFNPDVDWPLNSETSWFRTPLNLNVIISGNSVNISWDTQEDATGEIAYTSNGAWVDTGYTWAPKGPDGFFHEIGGKTKHHNILLTDLKDNTFYQFRIRSSNKKSGTDETIWGYVGNFTTSTGTGPGQNICSVKIPQNCFSNCRTNLLAYWSFDSTNLCDSSGNNNNGTVFGALIDKTGGYGGSGAYDFNIEYNDYIKFSRPYDTALNNINVYGGENGKSTITAWIKPRNVSKYNIITHHIGGFDYFSVGTTDTPGILRTMAYDKTNNKNYWPSSAGKIKENEWSHVAAVFEGGNGFKFYINGILDTNVVLNSNLRLYDYGGDYDKPYIGRGFDRNSNFDGMIDEVLLWNRALTNEEICQNAGRIWNGTSCT